MAKPKAKEAKPKVYTALEIIEMVDAKRKTTTVDALRDQMEADFDLFSLKAYTPKLKKSISYTSPKPKNDFSKVLNGLNKASLTWSIAVPEDAEESVRKAASKGEQFLTGILTDVDRNLVRVGEPTLRESVEWTACQRGMIAGKCIIYPNTEKDMVFDIRCWDPLHVTYQMGKKGPVWVAFEYHVSAEEAFDTWGVEIDVGAGEEARLLDFFTNKENAVVLTWGAPKDNSMFVKKPTPHGLDHVPVFIGFAGAMPSIFNKNHEPQLKHRAASVYASSRNVYETANKHVSFLMDVAEKAVAGTLVHKSPNGTALKSTDVFGNYKVLNLPNDESLEPQTVPKAPQETAAIMQVLDRDMQQSTVPYPVGYGIDTEAHSGAALTMLNDNTRSIYDPFASLIERFYTWLCEEILEQYKAKGLKTTVKGFNQGGKFFSTPITRQDIDLEWFIQVKCEPRLPRDEAGEMQMALAARATKGPDSTPLLSWYTVLEKILKLQNPDAERERIKQEMLQQKITSMPEIQIPQIADALEKAGQKQLADQLRAKLQKPALPPGAPQPNMPQPGMAQPMPGGDMPSPDEIQMMKQQVAELQAAGQQVPPEVLQLLQQVGG